MNMKPEDAVTLHHAADRAALVALGLAAIGLVFATSVASLKMGFGTALVNHGFKLAIATLGLLLLTQLPVGMLRRFAGPGFLVMLGLVAIAAFFFAPVNGASRWIRLAGNAYTFQPTELAKVALIVVTAHLAARAQSTKELYKALWPATALAALLFCQPDIGSALICFVIAVTIVFVAGIPWRHVLVLAGGGLFLVVLAFFLMSHVQSRVAEFLNPTVGSQVNLSLIALGNGGIGGTGLGEGLIKLGHLPKGGNDFIFAIVGEELGLFGSLGVLSLLFVFGWNGFRVAKNSPDRFLSLLAFGAVFSIVLQALAHVAVNTAMAPAKGIDFPFLGSGGSSLCFALGAVGLLRSVARCGDGAVGETLYRPRRIFGGTVANVERYGVLSLCFLIVVILGISLWGPEDDRPALATTAGDNAPARTGGLFDSDPDLVTNLNLFRQEDSLGQPEEDGREMMEVPSVPQERTTPDTPQVGGRVYRVRRGDCLGNISTKFYGTVKMVPKILKANPELKGDPNRIRENQELIIPRS